MYLAPGGIAHTRAGGRLPCSLANTPGRQPQKTVHWERRHNQLAARAAQFPPLSEDGPLDPPTRHPPVSQLPADR
jgi:hypothetical protein